MSAVLKLNAILRFHKSNFQILHWNTQGEEFDDAHKGITTDYYELCDSYVDSTAEMCARLDEFCYSYREVIDVADDNEWTEVESDQLYVRSEIIEISQTLLEEIIDTISECLDSEELELTENAGIRSEIESIQEAFDLQYRYINRRRSMNE